MGDVISLGNATEIDGLDSKELLINKGVLNSGDLNAYAEALENSQSVYIFCTSAVTGLPTADSYLCMITKVTNDLITITALSVAEPTGNYVKSKNTSWSEWIVLASNSAPLLLKYKDTLNGATTNLPFSKTGEAWQMSGKTFTPGNWYRLATVSDSTDPVSFVLRLFSTVSHSSVRIKFSRGTGKWRAEAFTEGYHLIGNPSYFNISAIRIVDGGVGATTHIDLQTDITHVMGANEVVHCQILENVGTLEMLSPADLVDVGASDVGKVLPMLNTSWIMATSEGTYFRAKDDGSILTDRIQLHTDTSVPGWSFEKDGTDNSLVFKYE